MTLSRLLSSDGLSLHGGIYKSTILLVTFRMSTVSKSDREDKGIGHYKEASLKRKPEGN